MKKHEMAWFSIYAGFTQCLELDHRVFVVNTAIEMMKEHAHRVQQLRCPELPTAELATRTFKPTTVPFHVEC